MSIILIATEEDCEGQLNDIRLRRMLQGQLPCKTFSARHAPPERSGAVGSILARKQLSLINFLRQND